MLTTILTRINALLYFHFLFTHFTVTAQNSSAPLTYVFVFGDSYTSTDFNASRTLPSLGNPFGNPSYPGVTSDSGANWIDLLIHNHSQPNTLCYNYAFPGALVTRAPTDQPVPKYVSFEDQIPEFMNTTKGVNWSSNNHIMMAWFGQNDAGLNTAFRSGPPNPTQQFAQIATTYFQQFDSFYQAGGRNFVAFLVPPLWRTPLAINNNDTPKVQQNVNLFNADLEKQAYTFQTTHAGAQVSIFDPSQAFTNCLDNPQQYGSPDATCTNVDGTSCLWWNTAHPGQAIQAAVADAAYQQLSELGFYRNEFTASVPKPAVSSSAERSITSSWLWISLGLVALVVGL